MPLDLLSLPRQFLIQMKQTWAGTIPATWISSRHLLVYTYPLHFRLNELDRGHYVKTSRRKIIGSTLFFFSNHFEEQRHNTYLMDGPSLSSNGPLIESQGSKQNVGQRGKGEMSESGVGGCIAIVLHTDEIYIYTCPAVYAFLDEKKKKTKGQNKSTRMVYNGPIDSDRYIHVVVRRLVSFLEYCFCPKRRSVGVEPGPCSSAVRDSSGPHYARITTYIHRPAASAAAAGRFLRIFNCFIICHFYYSASIQPSAAVHIHI